MAGIDTSIWEFAMHTYMYMYIVCTAHSMLIPLHIICKHTVPFIDTFSAPTRHAAWPALVSVGTALSVQLVMAKWSRRILCQSASKHIPSRSCLSCKIACNFWSRICNWIYSYYYVALLPCSHTGPYRHVCNLHSDTYRLIIYNMQYVRTYAKSFL